MFEESYLLSMMSSNRKSPCSNWVCDQLFPFCPLLKPWDARDSTRTGPNGFTEDVEALFLGYGWDGNVRDLQNVVSWAFSLAGDAPLITVDHLPQRVKNATARVSKRGTYYEELAQFRRHHDRAVLLEAGGNQSRAPRTSA